MRKSLPNTMILTFQTDILTCQTNFLPSDDYVMGLGFRGQKVCFVSTYTAWAPTNKHY